MSLVFFHGANVDDADREDWLRRNGHAGKPLRAVSTALLLDRCLSFERFGRSRGGGVVTLSVAPGHAVEGVVFEVEDEALALLDLKQGHPDAYLREMVHAVLPGGATCEAWIYDAPPSRRQGHVPPTRAYLDLIRRGLASHGLGMAAMEAAATGRPARPVVPWLFVYGTLRAGQANASLLEGLTRHPARTRGVLHDLGPYPVMRRGDGEVQGEIVPLEPARLVRLDALEEALPFGTPGGAYRRTVLEVRLSDGSRRRAQAYVSDAECAAPVIASGDWCALGDRRPAWDRHAAGRRG
ncbi:gamma-glutamylcyclotransferase family protein [Sabulicella glaciei]|uniref:Gamma-glutamylcyclotransferase family protein n=1 Tax=Sabulicella glaciei TaxID=2984948 RepID=A0ABT3NXS9_9PROT|nr:gamma-glutamylcyclotransferase family protein [Roseococcus sp. MDT2-1-1]MCW8086972.1 gamma-glutamylcyclotransferase [Roseococcus sp. MDT2-1-1]